MDVEPAEEVGAEEIQEKRGAQCARWCGRGERRQLLLVLVANLTTVGAGLSLGFSAVALPPLRNPGASSYVDEDQASWFASVAAVATPLGCLASGPLLDRWGRRATLVLVNVPCLLGWLALGSAAGDAGPAGAGFLAQLYAGRALTGVATGMASVPATVYAAEVAEPALRGLLVTWTSAAIAAGVLVVYLLGWAMPDAWRHVALWCAVMPAAAGLLVLLVLPESPSWLAARGREAAAEKALRRVRALPRDGPLPPGQSQELRAAADSAAAASSAAASKKVDADAEDGGRRRCGECWCWGAVRPVVRAWRTLTAPSTLKPLLILNGFFFFQQLSGVFVVIFYAVDVAREAGVSLDAYLASVLIGVVRFLVTIATGFLSQRFGRRGPAMASGAGMAGSAAALGLWLLLRGSNPDPTSSAAPAASSAWIPVTALLLYIATSTAGFLTLPWAMLGELFPARARGLAGGLTSCMAYLFSFVMLKLYPSMLDAMGAAGLFFFYSAAALAGTLFVAALLPETRGRSLQEIEDMFSGRRLVDAAPLSKEEGMVVSAPMADIEKEKQSAERNGDGVELQPLVQTP